MLDPALSPTRLVSPGERPAPKVVAEALDHGVTRIVLGLAGWLLGLLWLRLTFRLTPEAGARRLTALLERFGGLWIKAGQLLALRVDLFSAELCSELGSLETRGTAVPAPIARRILEQELGPIDEVFDAFEDRPFAATWIGQIHRARLKREQVWVAVKIQHPAVVREFARDLRVMGRVVAGLQWLGISARIGWNRAIQELEQIAREESDFRFEAAAITRMRKNLPRRKIAVPDVFSDYCTSRVLVTEFIHAALMSDFVWLHAADPRRLSDWLSENGIVPRVLARRLIHSFLRQVFEDNFYHGALYPGNIVLLRDNRVALLQFGACSFTEREYLHKLHLFFRALATRDYDKAADLALLLSGQLPVIPIEEVKEDLVRGLRTWASRTFVKGLPPQEKSIDSVTVVVTQILFKHGCPMDWAFLRVRRALTNLDASLVHLDPDINYTRLSAAYFRKAERRALRRAIEGPLAARALSGVVKTLDLQDRIEEYSLLQGGLIRRHAQVFQGATDKLSDLLATLLSQLGVVLLVVGAFFVATLIEQRSPGTLTPLVGTQLAALLERMPALGARAWLLVIAVTVYSWWTVRRLVRRFRQKEVRVPGSPDRFVRG
jgi:ubiquinone biosynthesis protein